MSDDQRIEGFDLRRLFVADRDDFKLTCPVCGFDYTHSIGACTRIGADEAGGAYRGTEPMGVTGSRRSALVVMFECESQHRFALVIQQHKGQNFCHVERLPDMSGELAFPDVRFERYWQEGVSRAALRLAKNAEDADSTRKRLAPGVGQ